MANYIQSKIDMYYIDLRNKAEDVAKKNLANAEKNSSFKDLNKELALLNIQVAKAEALKDDKLSSLETQQKKLADKRAKLLKEMNIEEKSLTPQYVCKKCNDRGFLKNGDKCSCYKQLESRLIGEEIGISKIKLYDFSAAKAELNPNINYGVVKNFCQKFPNTKTKNFVFFGHTGCGKTFVAQSIASELIKRHFNVVCVSAYQMNEAFLKCIKRDFDGNSFNYDKKYIVDYFSQCDLLVIDDLGCEPIMEKITLENFLNVLSARLFNKKSFIITTNLDSQQLNKRYGERIFSRLMNKNDTAFVNFYGQDIRTRKF